MKSTIFFHLLYRLLFPFILFIRQTMSSDDDDAVDFSLDMTEEDIEDATAYQPIDEHPFQSDHRSNFLQSE